MRCAEGWIANNNRIIDTFQTLDIRVTHYPELSPDEWYLIICNHQSWTDIVILQRILNKRVPMLKFFIKQTLLFVPILGVCFLALDFPIMKRYNKRILTKKPHLKGRDLETTLKSCERFKLTPVSVLNFVEGTRFSPEKQRQSKSPYQHLLKPKGGGVAMVVDSMQDDLSAILDVTLAYQDETPSFWSFICGHPTPIRIQIDRLGVPNRHDFAESGAAKSMGKQVKQILLDRWDKKDTVLQQLLEPN
jgi:1-acyl-sn-glycerol-3-phosphate acyltransferase